MFGQNGVRLTNRAPGRIRALIEDAANIGASEYYNSGGEFYFTLPAIHPQVGVIEPWQVHYALEVYRGQGWTEVAAGLITDFDATDDDVIFYGMDYMAVLGLLVDERFNVSQPDKAAVLYPKTGNGSKYLDKTITQIVADQLDRAIHGTDSPVAFMTRGPIATMNEKVTLFATFKNRLSFIAGLLDSHRGTNIGNRTRLRVRRALVNSAATYSFWVEDNPGQDRPNLRMEYGGLIQGMRVIAFGNWGTRVMAIGQLALSSKVEYISDAMGVVSETTYGRIPKVNLWPEVSDRNDLNRRARLMARQVSKVGKRVALGLRVDALGVKDNWDICDSVPVDIDRGIVETARYGSGLYTIVGWAFQLFPDGHTDLVLTLLPKMDPEPPATDLIPSDPILTDPTDRGPWGIVTVPAPPPPVNPLCATPTPPSISWPAETDVFKTIWCGILEPSVDFTEQFTITGGTMYDSPQIRWFFHPQSGPDYTVPLDNIGPCKPENGPNIGPATRRFASMGMGGVDYMMTANDNSGNVPGAAYRTAARLEYRGRGASSGFTVSNVIIKQRGVVVPQTP